MAKNSLGRIGFIFKGDYDSGSQYTPMDVVYYEGSSYICVKETFNNLPIDINYWFKLVEKGAAGDGFNNANYNEKTGILTFTNPDGSTVEVQLPLNTSELKKLQGTSFHITNSAKAPMKISPRGNDIEQETREGYNLINTENFKVSGTSKIVKANISSGNYTLNFYKSRIAGTTIGNQYLYGYTNIKFYQEDGTLLDTKTRANAQTLNDYTSRIQVFENITAPENTSYIEIEFSNNNGDNNVNTLVSEVMLVKGTYTKETLPPFEQYGAMPSLAFPSPVKHVGGSVKSYNLAYIEVEGQFREYTTGTFKGTANYNSYIANVNENKTYSSQYTGGTTGVSNLCFFDKDMTFLNGLAYSSEDKSFTTPENCAYVTMAVHINITDYMLVEGTEEKPYLPYGDIGSVYDIAKVNKNVLGWGIQLIDNIGWNASGVKYTTDNTFGTNDLIKVTDDVLTIYDKNYVATSVYGRFNTYDINKNLVSSELIQKMPFTRTFADNEKYYTFHILKEFISYGGNLQTEIGDTATDYTAHQEENYSLDLTGLPLYSKNDYIYKSGDKWYVHNEWDKVILNGTENWIWQSSYNRAYYNKTDMLSTTSRLQLFSNYFKYSSNSNEASTIFGVSSNIYLYPNVSTLAEFISWLGDNNVEVFYPLATPTETEITDETVIAQLEELYNTYAYDEVTNISVDNPILSAPLILDVEYYIKTVLELETKVSYEEYSVLEKRVKALENAILSLGGNV